MRSPSPAWTPYTRCADRTFSKLWSIPSRAVEADRYDGTRVFAKTCQASADFATRLSATYTYSPKR